MHEWAPLVQQQQQWLLVRMPGPRHRRSSQHLAHALTAHRTTAHGLGMRVCMLTRPRDHVPPRHRVACPLQALQPRAPLAALHTAAFRRGRAALAFTAAGRASLAAAARANGVAVSRAFSTGTGCFHAHRSLSERVSRPVSPGCRCSLAARSTSKFPCAFFLLFFFFSAPQAAASPP
jgi:hypothetical protein